jgi:hypothetical protein
MDKARAGRKLVFDQMSVFDSNGQSGGLLMLWRHDLKIDDRSPQKKNIDVIIEGETN